MAMMAATDVCRRYPWLTACLIAGAGFFPAPAPAQIPGITTPEIIARSVSPSCLDWRIVGACFWLRCRPKCRVRVTPKISHRLPDLVATAGAHECPWLEYRLPASAGAAVAGQAGAGGGNLGRAGAREQINVRFKDSMIVGNPTAATRSLFRGVQFLCKSKTEPLKVYFDSKGSAANIAIWRGAGAEDLRPEAWTPGAREIGHWPANSWGSVIPRIGFLLQTDDAKAGAVIAQRAIDIVVRNRGDFTAAGFGAHDNFKWETWGDPTAKTGLDCQDSGGTWIPPNPLSKRKGRCLTRRSTQWRPAGGEATDQWQMIYPSRDRGCAPFGAAGDWSTGRISAEGGYAFNYWQHYKCCIPGRGKYLGSKEF